MKFKIEYRTLFRRLHPRSPHSIRCARFIPVWRKGCKLIDAPSAFEAESEFIRDDSWKGEEREVLSVKQFRRVAL